MCTATGYMGCYKDRDPRDLSTVLSKTGDPLMTPDKCRGLAQQKQMAYFGLQWYNECYGSKTAPQLGQLDAASCNTRCSGDAGFMCGGSWANSVYRVDV